MAILLNLIGCCRNMPDVDALMEEWPPEFEELLKEVCTFILSRHINVTNISNATMQILNNNNLSLHFRELNIT